MIISNIIGCNVARKKEEFKASIKTDDNIIYKEKNAMITKVVNDTGLVQKPVYPFGVFRQIFFDNEYGISIIKNEASSGHEDEL